MSVQALSSRSFFLPDEAATSALGQRLASSLVSLAFPTSEASQHEKAVYTRFSGLRIHLSGPLGAGKTALVRAVLRGFGYEGRVRSPTYALLEPYALSVQGSPLSVYHFDLYRLSSPLEWVELGFRDDLDAGALCLIEWPEQVGSLLGPPDCRFTLTLDAVPAASATDPATHNPLLSPTCRWITAEALSTVGQKYLESV